MAAKRNRPGKIIKDEFLTLPLSRQEKYVLRNKRDKRCIYCGEASCKESYCTHCLVKLRERSRKNAGCKKRYPGSKSYILEKRHNGNVAD